MYPVDYGIHGFLGVQLAAAIYVGLTLGITAAAWWVFVPTEMVVVAFLVVGGALLVPFWPVFAELHPEHGDE